MTVVIDANVFSAVFDETNLEHAEFSPVRQWLFAGRGFMLYGGTIYKSEILRGERSVRLLRLLKDAGRAVEICDIAVDRAREDILSKTMGTDCNDQHIIALLIAARCALLCSNDKSSFPHIKNKALYPKKFPAIKIYTGARNRNLLADKSDVAAICNKVE